MFAATALKARHVLSILDFGQDEILKIVEKDEVLDGTQTEPFDKLNTSCSV